VSERIRLFSNGFEFEHWEGRNCSWCVKSGTLDTEPSCDLYDAITESMVTDGTFSPEIVARFEWTPEYRAVLGWPCPEKQTEPTPPKTATQEMAEAGVPMLEGFAPSPQAGRP
jgi:hypothetical protein